MKNLMPISTDVYDLLMDKGIKENEVIDVLKNILSDITSHYSVQIKLEENYFNMLQDIVWYNLEKQDENDLSNVGRMYPSFQFLFDVENKLEYKDIVSVSDNLKDIKEKLKDCYIVQLTGPNALFENPFTKICYVDKRKNKQIQKSVHKTKNMITCVIKELVSVYKMEEIKLNNVIDTLLDAIEKAEKNHSNIEVTFL